MRGQVVDGITPDWGLWSKRRRSVSIWSRRERDLDRSRWLQELGQAGMVAIHAAILRRQHRCDTAHDLIRVAPQGGGALTWRRWRQVDRFADAHSNDLSAQTEQRSDRVFCSGVRQRKDRDAGLVRQVSDAGLASDQGSGSAACSFRRNAEDLSLAQPANGCVEGPSVHHAALDEDRPSQFEDRPEDYVTLPLLGRPAAKAFVTDQSVDQSRVV